MEPTMFGPTKRQWFLAAVLCVLAALTALPARAAALEPALVQGLAGDFNARVAAIDALGVAGGDEAAALLDALEGGRLGTLDGRLVVIAPDGLRDAASGEALSADSEATSRITVNNRLRRAIATARAAFALSAPEAAQRLAAANTLRENASPALLPALTRALEAEQDDAVRAVLLYATAKLELASPDPEVRAAAEASIRAIDRRIAVAQTAGTVFSGLSLGSILLLAALGLAITYGVMGVINMAHGELLMVGAYATFLVQGVFRSHFPEYLDLYVLAAIPAAFFAAALVGIVMERLVLRHLYGRPLESLLATWGLSLVLIQAARVIFGPQNLELANPSWMSGGVELAGGVVLPYNRIVILGFAAFVLVLIWLMMQKTRLGMFVRAVTQNRPMAGCVGVPTARVDTLAFAIGSGVAGLGGLALSQIANVGPAMGTGYIVDAFMVVVLGGVGQLAGAVWAALGLGIVAKFLEGWAGAVVAKILVLVFIIAFIQKRPQGIFALKGRFADS
jgi:urea transport system permease protein